MTQKDPRALHDAAVEAAASAGVAAALWKENHVGLVVDGSWISRRDRALVDAAIRAYLAELARAGMKVVPRDITGEMSGAGEQGVDDNIDSTTDTNGSYDVINRAGAAHAAWIAMHDAAPAWPPVNDESD